MALILVVDDDPLQVLLRQDLLEAAGHSVRTAFSTAEAHRQLDRCSPDVFLTDLRFPNEHGECDAEQGLTLIREVRERAPGLPIIVISGFPDVIEGRPEERMVALVVTKPCRMDAMLKAIVAVTA